MKVLLVLAGVLSAGVASAENQIELFSEEMPAWVETRVKVASNNQREIVRVPLVARSEGWGCVCPQYYIGHTPNVLTGPWIEPVWNGVRLPDFPKEEGAIFVVEGSFTGKTKTTTWRTEKYVLSELKISSIRAADLDAGDDVLLVVEGIKIIAPETLEVAIDGVSIGLTPAFQKVIPGKHTVKACKNGYGCYQREITTEEGKVTTLFVTLEGSPPSVLALPTLKNKLQKTLKKPTQKDFLRRHYKS